MDSNYITSEWHSLLSSKSRYSLHPLAVATILQLGCSVCTRSISSLVLLTPTISSVSSQFSNSLSDPPHTHTAHDMDNSAVTLDYDTFCRAFLSPPHINFRPQRTSPGPFAPLSCANELPEDNLSQYFVGRLTLVVHL